MNHNPLFFLEFGLFSGVALAWALWELWSVRKPRDPAKKVSKDGAGHPER